MKLDEEGVRRIRYDWSRSLQLRTKDRVGVVEADIFGIGLASIPLLQCSNPLSLCTSDLVAVNHWVAGSNPAVGAKKEPVSIVLDTGSLLFLFTHSKAPSEH